MGRAPIWWSPLSRARRSNRKSGLRDSTLRQIHQVRKMVKMQQELRRWCAEANEKMLRTREKYTSCQPRAPRIILRKPKMRTPGVPHPRKMGCLDPLGPLLQILWFGIEIQEP